MARKVIHGLIYKICHGMLVMVVMCKTWMSCLSSCFKLISGVSCVMHSCQLVRKMI